MTDLLWLPAAADRFTPGRAVPIDRMVWHTPTVTFDQTIAVFQGGGRMVSAHYVIDRDVDRIGQCVQDGDTAWGAGDWPMNQRCLNVENVDNGDWNGPRPDAFYARAARFCADKSAQYGIPIYRTHHLRHSEVIATACPDSLDVDRIVREAQALASPTADPICAASQVTQAQLEAYLATIGGPAGIAAAIWNAAGEFGVRAEVMLAQQLKETNRYRYGGADPVFSATAAFNNFAGIKTTDATATAKFATVELGCVAQAAHLRWYGAPDHRGPRCAQPFDPRHFGTTHKNTAPNVNDLGGKWSPSADYGSSMQPTIAAIIATAAGGNMALDAADKAYIDQRIRDIVMGEPDLTGYALKHFLGNPHTTGVAKLAGAVPTQEEVQAGHGRG